MKLVRLLNHDYNLDTLEELHQVERIFLEDTALYLSKAPEIVSVRSALYEELERRHPRHIIWLKAEGTQELPDEPTHYPIRWPQAVAIVLGIAGAIVSSKMAWATLEHLGVFRK